MDSARRGLGEVTHSGQIRHKGEGECQKGQRKKVVRPVKKWGKNKAGSWSAFGGKFSLVRL